MYGWDAYENGAYGCIAPGEYSYDTPAFDSTSYEYSLESQVKGITLSSVHEYSYVKFNAVVPLFDVVDINYKASTMEVADSQNGDTIWTYSSPCATNVPLGIWFSGKDPIKISKDSSSQYAPSWSLMLASQFKPFPYAEEMPDETSLETQAGSFPTFAQVMSRQNQMIDSLNALTYQFVDISNRVKALNAQLNSVATSYTIDGLHKEMIDYEASTDASFSDFKSEIMSYIAGLKWQYIE